MPNEPPEPREPRENDPAPAESIHGPGVVARLLPWLTAAALLAIVLLLLAPLWPTRRRWRPGAD